MLRIWCKVICWNFNGRSKNVATEKQESEYQKKIEDECTFLEQSDYWGFDAIIKIKSIFEWIRLYACEVFRWPLMEKAKPVAIEKCESEHRETSFSEAPIGNF